MKKELNSLEKIEILRKRIGGDQVIEELVDSLYAFNKLDYAIDRIESKYNFSKEDYLDLGVHKVHVYNIDYVGSEEDEDKLNSLRIDVDFDTDVYSTFKDAVWDTLDEYVEDSLKLDGYVSDFDFEVED